MMTVLMMPTVIKRTTILRMDYDTSYDDAICDKRFFANDHVFGNDINRKTSSAETISDEAPA